MSNEVKTECLLINNTIIRLIGFLYHGVMLLLKKIMIAGTDL